MNLRTIRKQADNIHESCKSDKQRTADKTTKISDYYRENGKDAG
jgi:hypothetical protein